MNNQSSTQITVVILNNKAHVVVGADIQEHTAAVYKLIQQGGKELTTEIIGHEYAGAVTL